jgi:AraC-like DNA-binding protein
MDRLSTLLNHFSPAIQQVMYRELAANQVCTTQQSVADLYLIADGSLDMATDNESANTLGAYDVVWLPGGSEQTLRAGGQGVEFVHIQLQFGSAHLNPLLETLPEMIVLQASADESGELRPLVELMITESRSQRCGNALVLARLAEVLLVKLLRFLMGNMVLSQGVIGGLGDARLGRSLTAMHDHPEVQWTVQTLAQEAGMSRTAFSTRFHEVVGYPPGEYLSSWRMRLASEWLSETTQSIAQISEKLGYQNEAAFRRAFRKITGKPPGALRKQSAATPGSSL